MKEIIINKQTCNCMVDTSGNVYSKRTGKRRKPIINQYGYYYYLLTFQPSGKLTKYSKIYSAHKLVSLFYMPLQPKGTEINHIDMNKTNNHYTNLEYCTHKENINKARAVRTWKSGRDKGFIHSLDTRLKQSISHFKPVKTINTIDNTEINYCSIHDLITSFNITRRTFNRYANKKPYLNKYMFIIG